VIRRENVQVGSGVTMRKSLRNGSQNSVTASSSPLCATVCCILPGCREVSVVSVEVRPLIFWVPLSSTPGAAGLGHAVSSTSWNSAPHHVFSPSQSQVTKTVKTLSFFPCKHSEFLSEPCQGGGG
jgi:hypothetical protein